MNRTGMGLSLIVSALAAGCTTGQSNADTANAAASTTPQTVGAQSATDTNNLTSSGGVTGSSSTPKAATSAKRASTTTKVSAKSDSRTQKPADRDSILGYDSVIRFPIKTLPTATSTPKR